jgi:hypothetical protein
VAAVRLSAAVADRADGPERLVELLRLLEDHASAGSALARRVLGLDDLAAAFWVVEPVAPVVAAVVEREADESVTPPAIATMAAARAVPDPAQPVL